MIKHSFILSRYALQGEPSQSLEQFNQQLYDNMHAKLNSLGISRFTLNLVDDIVQPAASLRIQHQKPPIEATAFVWFEENQSADVINMFECYACVLSAYQLEEREPIPTPKQHQQYNGNCTEGFMQLAFLKVPNNLDYNDWLSIWQEQHTQVAIDIQSTFIYRQNRVLKCISQTDIGYAGIVEEAFPKEAMTSQQAFYAVQNEAELEQRKIYMWQSSKLFIDFNDLDVLPTTEYRW